jgi:TatD DNase family protein
MGDILEDEYARAVPLLMHCYTSARNSPRRRGAGAWFSVSGIATFKAAEDVRA